MSNDCRYFQCYKTEWKKNHLDNSMFAFMRPLEKWEVHGKFLPVSYHKTEKAAQKEYERRMRLPDYTPPKGNRTGK
jgi:hypothetical protein